MIHLIHEVSCHSETLQSLVATVERLSLPFKIHFIGEAARRDRFGVQRFRSYNVLETAEELKQRISPGDIVFFVTYKKGEKLARWLWLRDLQDIKVYGINHSIFCKAPPEWNRLILTRSKKNPVARARPYYQVEEPSDWTQPISIGVELPKKYFVLVGALRGILNASSDTNLSFAEKLPFPIVTLGTGNRVDQARIKQFGPVYCGLDDMMMNQIVKQSQGVVFLADPKKARNYKKKISGCFSLALKHEKALICAPEFYRSHFYQNGVDLTKAIQLLELSRAGEKAKLQKKRMVDHNTRLFRCLNKHGLVLVPPTRGMGSLGDEAIIISAVTQLQKQGHCVSMSQASRQWEEKLPGNPDGSPVRIFKSIDPSDTVLLCGADCLDGRYGGRGGLKKICAHVKALHIVGISARSCRFFDGLKIDSIRARDDETMAVLSGFPTIRCADPAYLLEPDKLDGALQQWIAQSQGVIIGVNFPSVKLVEPWLAFLVKDFPELSVIAIPHDFRNGHADLSAARETKDAAKRLAIRVWNGDYLESSRKVKGLVAQLDCVMSHKMHLCIAALGSGTPTIAFPYDTKFEGLRELFEENVLFVPNDKIDSSIDFQAHFEKKGRFSDRVQSVRELALQSLPTLEPM